MSRSLYPSPETGSDYFLLREGQDACDHPGMFEFCNCRREVVFKGNFPSYNSAHLFAYEHGLSVKRIG